MNPVTHTQKDTHYNRCSLSEAWLTSVLLHVYTHRHTHIHIHTHSHAPYYLRILSVKPTPPDFLSHHRCNNRPYHHHHLQLSSCYALTHPHPSTTVLERMKSTDWSRGDSFNGDRGNTVIHESFIAQMGY